MLSLFRNLAAAFLAIFVAGCTADDNFFSSGTGKISLSVDTDFVVTKSTRSRAEATAYDPLEILESLDVDDLSLRLVSEDGSFSKSWDNVKAFSDSEEFPVGSYVLSAYYGDPQEEGKDKPYLLGEKIIEIQGAKTIPVSLTASVANSIVSVDFTDNFRNYFSAFCGRIISANDNEFLFSAHETDPVYVASGKTLVQAEVTLPSGMSGTVNLGDFIAEPATFHRITLDVDASRGDLVIMLLFDDTLDERVVEREISGDLFDAGAPVVTPEGFEGNVAMPFVEGNYAFKEYKFNIAARRGLKELWLTRNSPRYGGGFQERYNLLNEQTRNDLISEHGIELIGIAEGEMFGKIDLTGWLKDLKRYDRAVLSEDVKFTLEVVDVSGATTDIDLSDNNILQITLYGESLRVELDESSVTDESYIVKVSTNMNWISGRLNMTQKEFDEEIIPDYEVLPDSVVDPTYTIENVFRLKVSLPGSLFRFTQTVESNSGTPGDNVLTMVNNLPQIEIDYNDDDIFATYGKINVIAKAGAANQALFDKIMSLYKDKLTWNVNITHTDDDGNAVSEKITQGNGQIYNYVIENYPDSKYNAQEALSLNAKAILTVSFDDIAVERSASTPSRTIVTESPLQLYNSDMEDWSRTAGQTNYWWIDYLNNGGSTYWATMNEKTTSQGGNSTLGTGASRNGCAYNANSGTQPTTDRHGGSYAAIIRTVGWGRGNTAAVFSGNFGNCYNVDAGELFLGSIDNEYYSQSYGIDFTSRPSAIRFWYKYSTVTANDDRAVVQAKVIDASNNTLFETDIRLSTISDYTLYEIPITYPENSAKAARLILTFKSSYMTPSELLSRVNSTYMTPPPGSNLTNGEYLGSKLYIDDIELKY